jgi:hypothetical protein
MGKGGKPKAEKQAGKNKQREGKVSFARKTVELSEHL